MALPAPAQTDFADAPQLYFDAVAASFEQAAERAGAAAYFYKIGGNVLCLRFAGQALASKLTRALAHCRIEPREHADLTLCCFDSETTHTPLPRFPWGPAAYGAKGHILGFNTNEIRTLYQPGVDILHLFDRVTNQGIYWVQRPAVVPYWESSFPARAMLHWWSEDQPMQLMHAGAVGFEDGGVLLAGKSGSGKSTTSLACLNSDLLYLSDDYVLTDMNPSPYVHGLYSTAKLVPDNVSRLPHLEKMVSNAEKLASEKAMIYLYDHSPEKISTGFAVKAIFLPRVTGERDTRLSKATPAESLFALAPTTILHLEGHSREAFAKISRFVQAVPNYWLELGTDMEQIPAAIISFLKRGA